MDRKMYNRKKILANTRENRMHVSFITRKGWCGRFTPVSWLCESGCELALDPSGYYSRPSRVFPSDRLRCPRLQLRGSAGFSPASHSASVSPAYDHARTQFEKEQKQRPSQSTGHANTKSNARAAHGATGVLARPP